MVAYTESSSVTLRIMERRSARVIADLDQFISCQWTERWRKHGSGQLKINAEDLKTEAVSRIVNGDAAVHIVREWQRPRDNGSIDIISDEVHGPILFYELDTDQGTWDLRFNDDRIYTAWRYIDTDAADSVDLGSVTAIEYIRSMLNSELLAPSVAARQIDVYAALAGATVGGGLVDLPVRWKRLDDIIEQACYLGDVGFVTKLNGSTVEFSAQLPTERTVGGVNAVVMNRDNAQAIIRARSDFRGVRNRITALGQGEGAARAVVTRSNTASITALGAREHVIDARDIDDTAGLNARGDAELQERIAPANTLEILGADRTFDVRPGHRITVEEYARTDSTSPDIGPVDILCVARTISLATNSEDGVRLQVGSEAPTGQSYTQSVEKRGQAAAFV